MNPESLVEHLKFVKRYNISLKEVNVLLLFLKKSYTVQELAKAMSEVQSSLHAVVFKLKLKNLIVVESKGSYGTIKYSFNSKLF